MAQQFGGLFYRGTRTRPRLAVYEANPDTNKRSLWHTRHDGFDRVGRTSELAAWRDFSAKLPDGPFAEMRRAAMAAGRAEGN